MSTPSDRPGVPTRDSEPRATDTPQSADGAHAVDPNDSVRNTVVERERQTFGGVKIGSAFFGWLTATGTAVILTALLAATGAAIGLGNNLSANEAGQAAQQNAGTVGIIGAIALVVVMFVSYFCGGYVAGRMARFDGAQQGLFVWLWAVAIAIAVAIFAAIAGSQYDILGSLNSFPRIPVSEGDLTTGSIVTAIVVAVVSLLGAILGGMAGMRFHRKVDRAGLGR